ncbi:MAG: sporulation protein [Halodesulfurarchaeum sp.]
MHEVRTRAGSASAAVDVTVPPRVTVGTETEATLEIHGGTADQAVDAVELSIQVGCRTPDGLDSVRVDQSAVAGPVTIHATDRRTLGVPFEIPATAPLTFGGATAELAVTLDRGGAPDPGNPAATTGLEVGPSDRMQPVFDALDDLGFRLRDAIPTRVATEPAGVPSAITQRFRFEKSAGPFADALDGVVIGFDPGADALSVPVQPLSSGSDSTGGPGLETFSDPQSEPSTDFAPVATLAVRETDPQAVMADLRRLLAVVVE